MRLFLNLIASIVLGLFVSGCSSTKKETIDYTGLGMLQGKDYADHLAASSASYLSFEEVKHIKLQADTIEYLESIYYRLVSNNQAILNISERPVFFIILDKSPFIFSLPRSQFFLSTSLIERYLKSEEIFIAAFSAEVLRSQRFLYEKKIMLPLGYYSTEKMIQMTRLKFETKQQVNEWTYFILKRAGYDPSAYLNWIQVQNRNTLDFAMFLGDPIGISREEHLYKNFMSKQGIVGVEKNFSEANSSKEFYKLLKNVVSRK